MSYNPLAQGQSNFAFDDNTGDDKRSQRLRRDTSTPTVDATIAYKRLRLVFTLLRALGQQHSIRLDDAPAKLRHVRQVPRGPPTADLPPLQDALLR